MATVSPVLDPGQPTGLLLNGGFEGPRQELAVENPYNGDTIASVAKGGPEEVAHAVAEATRHLPPHRPPSAPPSSSAPPAGARAGRDLRPDDLRSRPASRSSRPAPRRTRCVDTLTFSAVEARTLAGEVVPMDASAAGAGKLGVILREPRRRGRRDRAVQLPAEPRVPQARPGDRRRLPVVLKPASSTPLSALRSPDPEGGRACRTAPAPW